MKKQGMIVARDLAGEGKKLARYGTRIQLITACVLTLLAAMLSSFHIACSVAAGAAVSIIPNVIFAFYAFRYAGGSKNRLVAHSFNQGAKIKLALTIILFVMTFVYLEAQPLAVLMAFIITTVSYWLALLRAG